MIAVELDRVDPTIGQRIRNDIAAELNLRAFCRHCYGKVRGQDRSGQEGAAVIAAPSI
jgi:hypothetical protein